MMKTMMEQKKLVDAFQRSISYLRISVTDRCNLRCRYCAPSLHTRLDRDQLLTLEEIYRLVAIGTELGISKVRLTGGEPLVRKGLTELIQRLCQLEALRDVSLTTNGTLLVTFGEKLKQAGLKRINISLDTLDKEKFRHMTGFDSFPKVWDGIMTVAQLGFNPIKINTVVMKGYNDDEIEKLAALTLRYPFHIRFIEYMPIGTQPQSCHQYFMPASDVKTKIETIGKLVPVAGISSDGPAQRYRIEGAIGEIGLIGSMSSHFCGTCNRLRLTANGHLRPCLLADEQFNIIKPLRRGATDEEIKDMFLYVVSRKNEEHRLTFSCEQPLHSQMVSIGG